MSGHPPQRRIANVGSLLLTQQENEVLFSHLGRKCIRMHREGIGSRFPVFLDGDSLVKARNALKLKPDTPGIIQETQRYYADTLCSAVVQVFTADRNSSWNKRCCGVACLVKDNPQRSYFIRVFDIKDGRMMFEQELYNNFSIYLSKPYFVTFAGDTCQVGLNFANEEETKRFRAQVQELMGRRQRKTEKRRDPPNGTSSTLFLLISLEITQ